MNSVYHLSDGNNGLVVASLNETRALSESPVISQISKQKSYGEERIDNDQEIDDTSQMINLWSLPLCGEVHEEAYKLKLVKVQKNLSTPC